MARTYRNCQIVTASKFGDLSNVSEASPHDDGLVSVLLVVVVNCLHALHTRVFRSRILLLGGGLVPIQNTANEGRDEEHASFSTSNGLDL